MPIFSDAFTGVLGAANAVADVTFVDAIPISEDSDAKFRQYNEDFLYTDYKISNSYSKSRGIYMGGITSPLPFQGNSVAFVQINSPTLLWVCDWSAECAGAIPEIPNPTSNIAGWILLDDSFYLGPVIHGPDGVAPIYTMFGRYVYGNTNPNTLTIKDCQFPIPPWIDAGNTERIIPENKLKQGISTMTGGDSGGVESDGVMTSSSSSNAQFYGGGVIGG